MCDGWACQCQRALQACWDEYHELMPDALYEQVKAVLGIKVFEAKVGDQFDGTDPGEGKINELQ